MTISEKQNLINCLEKKCKLFIKREKKSNEDLLKKHKKLLEMLKSNKISEKEFKKQRKNNEKIAKKVREDKKYVQCQLDNCLEQSRKAALSDIRMVYNTLPISHKWYPKYKYFASKFTNTITKKDLKEYDKFIKNRWKMI